MKEFIPVGEEAIKLEGANLIEASAGTGKTYSIGLLVIRLLLEKDMRLGNILMVTFTNAAVAELAERIRKFILLGIKAARGESIGEAPIQELINYHGNRKDALEKLTRAFRELDEASIQTIHSFCQESLNTYALDSKQPFGLSLETDVLNIAEDYLKEFWRREMSSLTVADINEWEKHIDYDFFKEAVREAIGGREYAFADKAYKIPIEKYKKKVEEFISYVHKNKVDLEKKIRDSDIKRFKENAQIPVIASLANPQEFKKWLENEKPAQYLQTCYTTLFPVERKWVLELKQFKANVVHTLFADCVAEVKEKVELHLLQNHLLTYDEIIKKMAKAVKNEDFREQLRQKFSAVFIDEFQDTDKEQYEIYNELFGRDKIVFYIGDPKQSIYAWRKADLNTYTEAKSEINESKRFEMTTNFRSSKAYVEAVNKFYSEGDDDPFQTGKDSLKISYIPVKASDKKSEGLKRKDKVVKALQFFSEKKNGISYKIPLLVSELLSDDYKLNGKDIKKSDIGILVRTNKEARLVKKLLTREYIPAITVDDTKIFEDSIEAKFITYILEAALDATRGNIQKALLNNFTDYRYDQVINLDTDDLVDVFRRFRNTWLTSGVYAMVREYLDHFDVYRNLMKKENPNGSRILSNINQVLEILQEKEYQEQLKPEGLLNKFYKLIEGISLDADEYEQRIESDEEAVKILTIHKAKGLEYPIVIAPYLDLTHSQINLFKTFSYRDPKDLKYKFYVRSLEEEGCKEHHELQRMQENCRLLYVALTRAKYNAFLFKNEKEESTTLCNFIQPYHFRDCVAIPDKIKKRNFKPLPSSWGQGLQLEKFKLADLLYGKLSFSGISAHGAYIPKENNSKIDDDYDQFIFKDMPRGTVIGDMLHLLFENIDFQGSSEHHQEELEKLLDKFYPHKKEELSSGFQEMITHVLDAKIEIDGEEIHLRKISNERKRNEMEFDLKTYKAQLPFLNGFKLGDGIEIRCNTQHMAKSGLLNGLIDLFFEYKGKYYILDWKSNYLGDHLDHYTPENLTEAMNEGNYHLQYFIYAMAVKNYLEQRLPDFDYEREFGGVIYVYLRGAREDQKTGIYTNKPALEQVLKLEKIFNSKCLI